MAVGMSSGAEEALRREVNRPDPCTTSDLLPERYEIQRTADFIRRHRLHRVVLQFPDELLPDAAPVARLLREATGLRPLILADTSYGSCCVDEVSAEHANADGLVHYGHACLSPTRRLPVLYVFARRKLDVQRCVAAFHHLYPMRNTRVLLLCDLKYAHAIGTLADVLQTEYPGLRIAAIVDEMGTAGEEPERSSSQCCIQRAEEKEENCHRERIASEIIRGGRGENAVCEDAQVCKDESLKKGVMEGNWEVQGKDSLGGWEKETSNSACMEFDEKQKEKEKTVKHVRHVDNNTVVTWCGRQFILESGCSLSDYSVFYVGPASLALTNVMVSWHSCAFATFDPEGPECDGDVGGRHEDGVERACILRRRRYLVERVRDAHIIGIILGTLGMVGYRDTVARMREVAERAGKRHYTFAVGKLNPAKLANFPEIDVFVLVACPESSLILHLSEFYRPIVTPYEMEVACNPARCWLGDLITDFRELLPGGTKFVPLAERESEEVQEADVSLLSGCVRAPPPQPFTTTTNSTAIASRNQNLQVALADDHSAASFLVTRSWRGLEQKVGETPLGCVKEGRRGIAIGYEGEGVERTGEAQDQK
uniref:2-(3-amino-3-carboxypropyl)histidine synthase subunit 2 n=1 Tax=Myxine glutinosa TaxID=7769 RepID=UPI00358DDD2C